MFCIDLDVSISLILLNDHEFGILDYLVGAFPFKIFKNRTPWRKVCCVFVELCSLASKLFVNPFLARVSCEPLEDRILLLVILSHWIVTLIFLLHSCSAALLV